MKPSAMIKAVLSTLRIKVISMILRSMLSMITPSP